MEGLENIPDEGPALLIYYHGAVPIDVYYFLAKIYLYKKRLIHPVADRSLFHIPGVACWLSIVDVSVGNISYKGACCKSFASWVQFLVAFQDLNKAFLLN